LDAISGNLVDYGEQVYLNEHHWDVLSSIEEQFGCHQGVELHERGLFLAVENLKEIEDSLVDEGSA
jgi:hypothetical protein